MVLAAEDFVLHTIVLIFAVVLALSLCGVVGAILWLVARRGHRLAAQDLIPLVGFTLSGLVSFLVFTISISAASSNAPQKTSDSVPSSGGKATVASCSG
jgi:uncharacterized BrkB/YihY/UPF0761 family membrane protein